MSKMYDIDLDRNAANFQPLTPLTFLERAAAVFPDRPGGDPRGAALHLCRALRPRPPPRLRARQDGDRARRHRLGDAREHAGDDRGALRRADDRRRAQHAQHAARCRDPRLHPRPCRSQGADHRPRILQGDQGGAGARQGEAAGHRLRRSRIFRPRRAARHHRLRGISRRAAIPPSPGRCPTTNGTRSASTTPPAPPAIRRASSITTAAPICSRSATCSPATWASIPSICGRCRCSTATAGAFRGRSRWSPAPMCACARCGRRRSSTPSPATRSRICAVRRS